MHSSKLLQTLRALTPKELGRFQLYVASPFFTQRKNSQLLLTYLLPFAPTYSDPVLSEKKAFSAIFPQQPYQHQHLKDEMSQLFKLLRGFLAQLELEVNPTQQTLLALTQLRKRSVNAVFRPQYNALSKQLNQEPLQREQHFYQRIQLMHQADLHHGQRQRRIVDNSLQVKMDHLDAFYFYHKLRGSAELLNRKNIFSEEPRLPLIDAVQEYLETTTATFNHLPAIQVYHQIYLTLTVPKEEKHYRQLVLLLEENGHQFDPGEARAMYKYAQNYCIGRINSGERAYLEEIFQLYQRQLSSGIIYHQGILSHSDFTNIVTTGLRLKQFEWVEQFMEAENKHLLPSLREAIFHYNLAACYFEQQQFRPAIRALQGLSFEDVYYELSAKVLLCKVYFESGELEALFYLIDAFKRFLKRNKAVSPHNRAHYLNFLKYLYRLATLVDRRPSLSPSVYQERLKKIAGQLQEATHTSNLAWLRQQADG